MGNKKCEDLVFDKLEETVKDIQKIMDSEDPWGEGDEDLGGIHEYGLSFDHVEAGTFENQRAPYYRWQLCYGGPSMEFRMYHNDDIEFWYLDWYDGASTKLVGDDYEIVKDIMNQYVDCLVPEERTY